MLIKISPELYSFLNKNSGFQNKNLTSVRQNNHFAGQELCSPSTSVQGRTLLECTYINNPTHVESTVKQLANYVRNSTKTVENMCYIVGLLNVRRHKNSVGAAVSSL